MQRKKKSVAESVEHLLKPKSLAQSDSEDESHNLKFSESLANVNAKQRPSGVLKRSALQLHKLDKKYKGIVASRKDFEDEESVEDSGSEEATSEEEDELDTSDDDQDEESEEEEEDAGISDFINQFKSQVQTDAQIDSDGEESADGDDTGPDEEYSDDDKDSDGSDDDEDEEQQGSEDEVEEEDSETDPEETAASPMKILQPMQENSVQKGHAVRTQLDLWERILETRIKIQPVLNKANGFPDAELFFQFESASGEFKELAGKTQRNVATLLDNLINLQNSMMAQFSETRELLKAGLHKRKFVAEQEQDDKKKLRLDYQADGSSEEVFKTYRNSVIQKWSDRTKVTNARSSKELLSNHNVLNQIEGVLLNKSELVKNSQTVKGTYTLFGAKEEQQEDKADGVMAAAKWCPEIYDDSDFYHQMLRELIEYKSNSSTNPAEAARNYSELQKLRTKIKKQVDQKASKGRKIRWVVKRRGRKRAIN